MGKRFTILKIVLGILIVFIIIGQGCSQTAFHVDEKLNTSTANSSLSNDSSDSMGSSFDSEKPSIELTSQPGSSVGTGQIRFEFSVTDNSGSIASIECKLNTTENYTPCSSGIYTVNITTDGSYTFSIQAKDRSNNTSLLTYNFIVDSAIPLISLTSNRTSPTNQNSIDVSISAMLNSSPLNISYLNCRLDSNSYAPCAANTISLRNLSGGTNTIHNFYVQARNPTNGRTSESVYTWRIDSVPPNLSIATHTSVGPSGTINYTSGDTTGSGIRSRECRVTMANSLTGAFVNCSTMNSHNYSGLTQGNSYILSVRVTDNAGNISSVNSSVWTVPTASTGGGGETPNSTCSSPTQTPPTPRITTAHPCVFNMELVFPLNSQSAAWAYNKNAYPGMKWEIPIVVRGGRWPYHYSVVNQGSPSAVGLQIGSYLNSANDPGINKTIFSIPSNYGVLSWETPVAGVYNNIVVEVKDQDGRVVSVEIDLTVGTAGWVFVNSETGTNPSNISNAGTLGTRGNPIRDFYPLHNNSSNASPFRNNDNISDRPRRVVIMGNQVLPMVGISGNSGRLRFERDNLPLVYIAYPGSNPVLEFQTNGNTTPFFVFGGENTDFYMSGISLRFHENYIPSNLLPSGSNNFYMFRFWNGQSRHTFFRNKFLNFHGNPTDYENSAIMYFDGQGSVNNISIVRNQIGNDTSTRIPTGTFIVSYNFNKSVLELNTFKNINVTAKDESTHGLIWLKDSPNQVVVRANEAWDNIFLGNADPTRRTRENAAIGIMGQHGSRDVEFCYNKVLNAHAWNNDSGSNLITNIHWYRNSILEYWRWAGAGFSNYDSATNSGFAARGEHLTSNIIGLYSYDHHRIMVPDGSIQTSYINAFNSRLTQTGNVTNNGILSSSLLLTGDARANYLGTVGAELAIPINP